MTFPSVCLREAQLPYHRALSCARAHHSSRTLLPAGLHVRFRSSLFGMAFRTRRHSTMFHTLNFDTILPPSWQQTVVPLHRYSTPPVYLTYTILTHNSLPICTTAGLAARYCRCCKVVDDDEFLTCVIVTSRSVGVLFLLRCTNAAAAVPHDRTVEAGDDEFIHV